MKNINSYDSFLNEYYKGKNNTIGFRYSEAEVDLDIYFNIVINNDIKMKDLEYDLIQYFNENIIDYVFDLENISDEKEKNEKIQEIALLTRGAFKTTDIFDAHLTFRGYSENEAYSLLENLIKEMNYMILPLKLNGEMIDGFKWLPEAKKKIGF